MARIPIACSLEPGTYHERIAQWDALIASAATARTDIDGGVELRFSRDVASELQTLADAERSCCAWAAWEVSDDGDSVVLRATATEHSGVDVLRAVFSSRT